ncbi:nuclease domain-containing protein [Geobacillus sp. FSL W8-0032]|uniref:nuclease domain-containing protein n=1 Tax=Geobacillus TaxID=129337 RepID=UPI00079A1977|nr:MULTISPECIES: nuclease domain-containing protein [Geobacillus]KYD29047.1 hypothetical protein B4113_2671 [Geobacillus sp. B4113_201601]
MSGPMEDDINTMHRYRDSLVARRGGPYERTAFGAYVPFPWHDEDSYQAHPRTKASMTSTSAACRFCRTPPT